MKFTKVNAEQLTDMVLGEVLGTVINFGLPSNENHTGVEDGIELLGSCYAFESPTCAEYFIIEDFHGCDPMIASISKQNKGHKIDAKSRDDIETTIEKFFNVNKYKFVHAKVDA